MFIISGVTLFPSFRSLSLCCLLPRHMEGMSKHQCSDLIDLSVLPQAVRVFGDTYLLCFFCHMVSILCTYFLICKYTLHVYYVFNIIDGFFSYPSYYKLRSLIVVLHGVVLIIYRLLLRLSMANKRKIQMLCLTHWYGYIKHIDHIFFLTIVAQVFRYCFIY